MDVLTRRCSSGVSWKIYSTRSLLWSLSYPLNDAGVGPENVQRLFSRLKSPEGIEVPGLMACGSMIQRSTQSGLRRPLAWRKFGAVAILSWAGSPVAWHFKQGAAVLLKRLRAMSVSGRDLIGGSPCSCTFERSTSLLECRGDNPRVCIDR